MQHMRHASSIMSTLNATQLATHDYHGTLSNEKITSSGRHKGSIRLTPAPQLRLLNWSRHAIWLGSQKMNRQTSGGIPGWGWILMRAQVQFVTDSKRYSTWYLLKLPFQINHVFIRNGTCNLTQREKLTGQWSVNVKGYQTKLVGTALDIQMDQGHLTGSAMTPHSSDHNSNITSLWFLADEVEIAMTLYDLDPDVNYRATARLAERVTRCIWPEGSINQRLMHDTLIDGVTQTQEQGSGFEVRGVWMQKWLNHVPYKAST